MTLTRNKNGVKVTLTAQEEANVRAEWAANKIEQDAQQAKDDALKNKKDTDIAALGTRAEMQAEAAAANSIPALRVLVLKLAEIIYTNEKNSID